MLPSQGLFRSIPCPFFLAGLCERPHCSFRHCRSDIRIDRKLESESLGEVKNTPDKTESTPVEGLSNSAENYANTKFKEPVNRESLNNNIKSDTKTNSNDLLDKRLETSESSDSKSSKGARKRSRDSVSEESSKRRKVSTSDCESEDMGLILTTIKKTVQEFRSGGNKVEKDLDELVKEIEECGSSNQNRHKNRKHKKHKHHSKNSEDSNASETSKESNSQQKDEKSKEDKSKECKVKDRRSKDSSSSREKSKDDKGHQDKHSNTKSRSEKSNTENRKGRDEKKDKDSPKKDDHKRKKDSKESSGTSSPKDNKRSRKSSECSDSSSNKRHEDKAPSTSKGSTTKESPSKSDSSLKSVDGSKEALKIVQNNVDISNRFSALADSANESAYSSDILDDSFDFNYPGGSDSEDDPEMVARECLELFENYKPEVKLELAVGSGDKKEDDSDEGFCVVGKKRVAHGSTLPKTLSPTIPRSQPVTSKNLQGTLLKRLEDQSKISTNAFFNGNTSSPKLSAKPRIAHVPNVGNLIRKPSLSDKKDSLNSSRTGSASANCASSKNAIPISRETPGLPGSLTYSQTAAKGVKREAHKSIVNVAAKVSPTVFKDAINKTSKIPHLTRQQILDKMFAEYSRIFDDYKLAFDTTISRENELLGKCSSKQVYLSSGISIISGLRKTHKQDANQAIGSNRIISHAEILSGSLEAKNCSVRTVKRDDSVPIGNKLYRALRKYVLTELELEGNGYPRPHPSGEPGRAVAKPRIGEENSMTLVKRVCDRCKKWYETAEDGEPLILEVCNYHWARKFNTRGNNDDGNSFLLSLDNIQEYPTKAGRGAREATFICCGVEDELFGCATAVCHVSKCPVPISCQKGFVEAVLEEGSEEKMGNDSWDIIGVDCEMVYTTHGNELARVTVVSSSGAVLYDEVVRPIHRVLDCNTRFSGITYDDLDKATRTITEVQAIMLTHIRPNTIIIGHSLESDLLALRVKHECVIDTAILYPHRMGPPKKRALKNLSADILKKVIQDSEAGHDSAEDAQIAVELVLAKLKSDNVK